MIFSWSNLLVLTRVGLVLIRVHSCLTSVDSCRTRLIRVDLCWHSCIRIDLIVLSCQSKNIVGKFKKVYLHRPINILHFLAPAIIHKCLTQLQNILAFLTINHLLAESRITRNFFTCYSCSNYSSMSNQNLRVFTGVNKPTRRLFVNFIKIVDRE